MVPQSFVTDKGFRLGTWVHGQSQKCNSPERRARLEALPGWSWNPKEEQFEEGLSHLHAYAEQHGDSMVPKEFVSDDGFHLGRWVANQLTECTNPERRARLEALPGWRWKPTESRFEQALDHLVLYVSEHGTAAVPPGFVTSDGFRLGAWAKNQRSQCTDAQHRKKLEQLPGWTWNLLDAAFDSGFEELQRYAAKHGGTQVRQGFIADGGYPLGNWVGNQRSKCTIPERRARLEALPGWYWAAKNK
jgi:hypothetical protein